MKALWFDKEIGKVVALQLGKVFSRDAVFAPFSPFHYSDTEEPAIPNPRWLKVRNKRCGLCAPDIRAIFADISPKWPSPLSPAAAGSTMARNW